jgi:rRNA maturation endonuclease Nob1
MAKAEKKARTEEVKPRLICPFCNNEIEEHWIACPICGMKLKDDTQIY